MLIYSAYGVPIGKLFFVRFPREKRYDIFWAHFLLRHFATVVQHFAIAISAMKPKSAALCNMPQCGGVPYLCA